MFIARIDCQSILQTYLSLVHMYMYMYTKYIVLLCGSVQGSAHTGWRWLAPTPLSHFTTTQAVFTTTH